MDLVKIESPAFLKTLSIKELESLSTEIREFLITNVSKTGGYLASNLSSVELSIGLHRVFNSPADKILFDPDNQSYTHKILTGRANAFKTLRQVNGMSSFQSASESEHDPYEATTIGQSLSIAYGLSMKNDADQIICVLSHEALNKGIVFEALNHISSYKKKVIIVINDYSDASGISGLATSLKNLALAKPITQFRDDMSSFFEKGNLITKPIKRSIKGITSTLGKTVTTTNIFTELGFRYIGPFDGHKISDVNRVLKYARDYEEPIVIHFKTIKGKGYQEAHHELKGHWIDLNDFDPNTGKHIFDLPEGYCSSEDQMIETLKVMAESNPRFMVVNTVSHLEEKLKFVKGKIFNIHNALAHGFSFASGLCLQNLKPVLICESKNLLSVYETLLSEISLVNCPMTIIALNSGFNEIDGGLQKGIYDLSLFSKFDPFVIAQPKNNQEIHHQLLLTQHTSKVSIVRLQDQNGMKAALSNPPFILGQWEINNLEVSDPSGIILTYGSNVETYLQKSKSNYLNLWVVNMRYANPMDEDALSFCLQTNKPIYIVSDDFIPESLLCKIDELKKEIASYSVIHIYQPQSQLYKHGPVSYLRKQAKIDSLSVLNDILNDIEVNNN